MKNSEVLNKVTVCDINPNMLEVGKKRAVALGHEESKILNLNIFKFIYLFFRCRFFCFKC
jgi:ubiquinone/menaquinone biosynthesis C-methylase UbiE